MMLMVNNKELMGQYVNNKFKNAVGWVTIIILITLTAVLTVMPFAKKIFWS